MSVNFQNIDKSKLDKLFRSFEIITEFREILRDNSGPLHQLPRKVSLFAEFQFLPFYFGGVPWWRILSRKLSSKKRIVPNYIMTGPIKCGSSDMVSHLLLHPNIMHPLAKEFPSLNPQDWKPYYPSEQEKQQRESLVDGPVRCGFLEPFLNNITLMNDLYELNPDSKVIITLRDPVSRTYSHWKWDVFLGGLSGKNIESIPYIRSYSKYVERAIDLFPSISMESYCGFPVLQTGIYHKAVEHWVNRFGRENVLIIDSAEYFANRKPTLEKVQRVLELPIFDIPEYDKKANENPVKLPPPDAEANAALSEFYKPYNEKLFGLIHKEFDWK